MRNYKIDILRGISILLVLLHHFNIPYKLKDTWLGFNFLGEAFSTVIARNGNYGVTMFFVISGFLITHHTLKRDKQFSAINLKHFYIRRAARILPCLVLLILGVSLLGSFDLKPFVNQAPNGIEVSYPLTIFAALTFWMNILIIKFGWVNYALGVLWSLSVEEVFYFVFPLLCLLTRSNKVFIAVLIGVILYGPYFRSLHFGEESGAYLYHYFSSFDGIAIGCLTAIFSHTYQPNWTYKKPLSWLIILSMTALHLYAPIKEVSTWGISLFAFATGILILCFQHPTGTQVHSLFTKVMVWLGQRSYETYLFHLVVLGLMKVAFIPAQTDSSIKIMLLIAYLIVTFIISAAIEKYYSTPLNSYIRKVFIKDKS
ncbi:acyltransferase [Acinetobacter calcoaceticus]|uniref:acyltransferase family protein n=1 Tax=Acinetobacter calcoaceticus TaxID=471 RepID=UPI0005835491|nr:acyltransferase [Acinetobacter calcoaceticus]GAM31390.1 acyltransferase [Acinetobacter calcoaceticus]